MQRTFLGLNDAIMKKGKKLFNESEYLHTYPTRYYGLYGADIFFTKAGKVVIFELNHWPGMNINVQWEKK